MSQLANTRYEAICEASPDAILLVDAEGQITYANGRVTEMFGYAPAELIGEPIEIFVPESKREAHVAQRNAYLADPETRPMGVDLDLSARCKDGTTIPVDISLSPIASDGEFVVMAAIRDISDQESLRAKYQTILEAVPDAVVVAETTTGEIVEVNDQVSDLFGYTPDELLGKEQFVLHPSGEEDRYRELFEQHVTLDEAVFTKHPDGSDIYVETRDGQHVPVEINAQVFELGERRLIVGVFRDISTRKEYERQLETLHEASRQLMQADSREEIADLVARAANQILGFSSNVVRLVEERRLRPIAVTEQARMEMGPRPDYPLSNENPVSEAFESGELLYVENVENIDDGVDRGKAGSAVYLPLDGHGVVSIVENEPAAFNQSDIELASVLVANAETALDRLADERALERQNARLDEFASIVSHDLRNPLSVAHGWLDVAHEENPSEALTRVKTAIERMDEMIDDSLTLARQGQTVDEREPIDIPDLARECWGMVATEAAELEITDEFRLQGDRSRLQHVFENLFRNAIEHGGEDVIITLGRIDEEGFFVEDNGPGIPDDVRETVFAPGHTTEPEGTGLGLTIVKEIAAAHGWTVRLSDRRTDGARFEFTGVDFV